MATKYRVLGQKKLATGGTAVVLYYCDPGSGSTMQTIVSTITVCNTGSVSATYDIAVVPSDSSSTSTDVPTSLASNPQCYVVSGAPIGPKETMCFTVGLTLDTYDKIVVSSSTTGVMFNAYGSETQ